MFMRSLIRLWALLLLSLMLPTTLYAADAPRARAVRVMERPVIDGILDDAVWEQAEVIDQFTQVEPVLGDEPSHRTEVRFLTDDRSLFIYMRAYDDEPEKIVANLMGRGEFFFFDDSFTMVLDTFHDHRNGYFIQVNPNGGRRDGIFEGVSFEESWDGIWYAKARIDEEGWTAEIELPLQTFSFRPGDDAWGFNMSRRIRRYNEDIRWADPTRERNLVNVSQAGTLEGLSGAQQGLGLRNTIGDDKQNIDPEPSFDARYRLLPSLTASATVNTDFSQTAVDDRQINLTRFALFFPERREFFLQDAGIFSFGGLDQQNGLPFFSRRIGLADDGESIRLHGGGKVTGRVGRFNIGALNIQQDGNAGVRDTNLSVVRMSSNVLEESKVGFIVTHGDPLSNDSNLLGGLDFNYRSNDLVADRVVAGTAWVQQSFSGDSSSDYSNRSSAFGGEISYPNDIVNWKLGYRELQGGFNPALGFVNRTDIRRYQAEYRYRIRPVGSSVRTFDIRLNGDMTTGRNDDVESASVQLRPLRITTQIEDVVEIRLAHLYENVADPFYITDHVGIPSKDYHYSAAILDLSSSRNRQLSGQFIIGYGTFFDGTALRVAPSISWRPSPHLLFSLEHDERQFWDIKACNGAVDDLGDGLNCEPDPITGNSSKRMVDFATRVTRLRVKVNFTPDISWETISQYDNISNEWGAQSRFRWIIEEGRDLFLTVAQNFDATQGDFRVGETISTVKLRWTFRF
jgi:hypothetical protein